MAQFSVEKKDDKGLSHFSGLPAKEVEQDKWGRRLFVQLQNFPHCLSHIS